MQPLIKMSKLLTAAVSASLLHTGTERLDVVCPTGDKLSLSGFSLPILNFETLFHSVPLDLKHNLKTGGTMGVNLWELQDSTPDTHDS